MKHLYLLRHSKSGPSGPGQGDHERTLNARGVQDAMALAEHCAASGIRPELVLCSTATRTRETLHLLLPFLEPVPRILHERGLYLASAEALTDRLRELPESIARAMLVGHNDGLFECAAGLAGSGDPVLLRRLMIGFPTGALACLELDGDWSGLRQGRARLASLVTPRELSCAR